MDIDHDDFLVNEVGHSQADNLPNLRRLSDDWRRSAQTRPRGNPDWISNTVRNDFWYWPFSSALDAWLDLGSRGNPDVIGAGSNRHS